MFVVLWTNSGGNLMTSSFPEIEEANDNILELSENNGNKNVRLLTDVLFSEISPYKVLYEQLYRDFVSPHSTKVELNTIPLDKRRGGVKVVE